MKKLILFLILTCAFALAASAQTIAPIRFGAALPATCTPDKNNSVLFYKTGTSRGLYECTAPDTWVLVTGGGSVTSVGLSLPAIFSVTGSPVTTSGTLTASLVSQNQNLVLASPNGSSGAPTFRALVANDIPSLATSKITSGVFSTARLGTGTANSSTFLRGDGAWSSIPAASWGTITGTLGDQTDLASALSAKAATATTITAGAGLTGGGDLSTNRTIALDIDGQSEDASPDGNDFIITFNANDGFQKVKISNLPSGLAYTSGGTNLFIPYFDGTGFLDSPLKVKSSSEVSLENTSGFFKIGDTSGNNWIGIERSGSAMRFWSREAATNAIAAIQSHGLLLSSGRQLILTNSTTPNTNTNNDVGLERTGNNIAKFTNGAAGWGTFLAGGGASIEIQNPSDVGFIVKGATSQTANLQEWRDSTGTKLVSMSADGRIVGARRTVAAKTANYTIGADESGTVFNNKSATGGITFSLPAAAEGLHYTFCVYTPETLTIKAVSGDFLQINTNVSGDAGTASSSVVGDCVTLVAMDNDYWFATNALGSWTVSAP
jgi:hypothetical protein